MKSKYYVHNPFGRGLVILFLFCPVTLFVSFDKHLWALGIFLTLFWIFFYFYYLYAYGRYADIRDHKLLLKMISVGTLKSIPLSDIARVEVLLNVWREQPVAINVKLKGKVKKINHYLTAMGMEMLPQFIDELRANGIEVWTPIFELDGRIYTGDDRLKKYCKQHQNRFRENLIFLSVALAPVVIVHGTAYSHLAGNIALKGLVAVIYLLLIGGYVHLFRSAYLTGGYPELEDDPDHLIFGNLLYGAHFRSYRYTDIKKLVIRKDKKGNFLAEVHLKGESKPKYVSMGCMASYQLREFMEDIRKKSIPVEEQ